MKMSGKHYGSCECPVCHAWGGKHYESCECPVCHAWGGEHYGSCECPVCHAWGGKHYGSCECPACHAYGDNANEGDRSEKGGGGCFITTAVLSRLGKDDRCRELQRFRWFRDTWLRCRPYGPRLIQEYYSVAPKIVEEMLTRGEERVVCEMVWLMYLEPALEAIERGRFTRALSTYQDMVFELRRRYLPSFQLSPNDTMRFREEAAKQVFSEFGVNDQGSAALGAEEPRAVPVCDAWNWRELKVDDGSTRPGGTKQRKRGIGADARIGPRCARKSSR